MTVIAHVAAGRVTWMPKLSEGHPLPESPKHGLMVDTEKKHDFNCLSGFQIPTKTYKQTHRNKIDMTKKQLKLEILFVSTPKGNTFSI